MQVIDSNGNFFIKLERGEYIMKSLRDFVISKEILGAKVSGIGALEDIEIGFYHLHEKKYDKKAYKDEMELISLDGNVSWLGNDPIIHLHASLGKEDMSVIGGHLFDAKVAVTAEIFITPIQQRLERALDPEIGLNLIKNK